MFKNRLSLFSGRTLWLLPIVIVFNLCAKVHAAETSAYRRHIIHDGGMTYYVVGPRAPHLFMISRDLYGDEQRWQDIAQWNELKAPYILKTGQRLIVKSETTQTDSQANRQLITAWIKLQQDETADEIALVEKADSALIVAETIATPPVAATPVVAATSAPAATPVASPTPAEKGTTIEATPLPEHETRWHFAIAPLVSLAKLHSEFSATGIKNTLATDLDYGADADISFKYNDTDKVFFGAGVEHMDVRRPANGNEIEGESQNLAHFAIGLRHELGPNSSFNIAVIEDGEAFSKPTSTSAEVEVIDIPQFSIGAEVGLIHHPKFDLGLSINALLPLPTKKDVFDFEMGYGAMVGLNFKNEFNSGALIYGLSARYLNQEARDIKTWQEMALARLGWEF